MTHPQTRSRLRHLSLVLLATTLLLLGTGCANFPANGPAPLDTSPSGK